MTEVNHNTVSIVVPVFNGGDKFKLCLDSLEKCSPAPLEIIVVADGQSDASWRLAQEKGFTTIVLEDTGGPARARNIGAESACGEILLFIDADVLVQPDIIKMIGKIFDRSPNVAAAIGSFDNKPTEKSFISQYRNLLHHFTHQTARKDASTFWGACGAVRRVIFLEANGFDERYKQPSIEDIDLGYRLKARGYRITLEKQIQVTHMKRWDLLSMLKTDIFSRAIPWSKLLLEKNQIINDLNLSLSSRFSTALVFLSFLSPLLWIVSSYTWILTICSFLLLLAINRRFYTFLQKTHGVVFMLKALPLHWLYFFYSGMSFLYVLISKIITGQLSQCKSCVYESQ